MNFIVTSNEKSFEKHSDYKFLSKEDYLNLKLDSKIAFDSETTGLDWQKESMFCFQIRNKGHNYLIDYRDKDKRLLEKLKEANILVIHNALFDLKFLYKENFIPNEVSDTLLASSIIYNGLSHIRHSFKECMERELEIIIRKEEQKTINKTKYFTYSKIMYCFNDVDKLLDLELVLRNKIIENGSIWSFALHNEHIKALAYIEMCGLPLSKTYWKKKMEDDEKLLSEKKEEVEGFIIKHLPKYKSNQLDLFSSAIKTTLNLSSPIQMVKVFKELGINTKDDEGNDSINENVINKSDHPFVKIWLSFQEPLHRVTTFGKNIYDKIQEDGRIYTEFKPILDTARIASRKGCINFLNFPSDKNTRDCFRVNKGTKLIVADYSSQENFVTADLTGDKVMTDACLNDLDLHCAFARLIFPELKELSDEEIIKNHKGKRSKSKAPRFAFSFGGNAFTVAKNENISMEEANKLEVLYKELHPGIYENGERVLKEALERGFIRSAGGFILHLPFFSEFKELEEQIGHVDWTKYKEGKTLYKDKKQAKEDKEFEALEYYLYFKSLVSKYYSRRGEYFRLALNNPCQTTAAHQTKLAVVYLFREIVKNGHFNIVRISNVIHDEIVLETPEDLALQYKDILSDCMIRGGNFFIKNNKNIKMKAEANIGDSWYEAK